ncbi:MAG: DNA polymerase IV [Clostridiales bacterium]|nr:DNA polymerase IV [Clostridiales bacterium]
MENKAADRIILHVDQNCFFASVGMIYHPEYRNVPMAVAGDDKSRHGIILAKNQLASKCGIKTAEVIWQAKSKCPDLVLIPPEYDKYEFYSKKLKYMYTEYTDRVEPFGLDECWLDMTGILKDMDEAKQFADDIRSRVKEEFKLTCSVGVSFNKCFAKLGSDYKKPDATTVIPKDSFKDIVWPLPASDLLFVGRSTVRNLSKINVNTIGDLARLDREYINSFLGKNGILLWEYANGIDDSPVNEIRHKRDIKSIGNSTTPPQDMTSVNDVRRVLMHLAGTVAERLRRHKFKATMIQIHVRDRDLHIYEHQKVLFEPTDVQKVIYEMALELFTESYDWHTTVRSIGIRCANLIAAGEGEQLSLFTDMEKREKDEKIGKAMDDINRRFGKGTVKNLREIMDGGDGIS